MGERIAVVFDVESIGLHGQGFQVGAVVVDLNTKQTLEEFLAATSPKEAAGAPEDREWVMAHVPAQDETATTCRGVREQFWALWRKWADKGAVLVTDCGWPVEANFLSACVRDDPGARTWKGPYPLLDLSTLLWAQGIDPTQTSPRLANELPEHNPLADARQSARILMEGID